MNNPIDEILQRIEGFMRLDPSNIGEGDKLGREIVKLAANLEGLISGEGERENYSKILSRLRTCSSKLSRDILNSKKGSLASDWRLLGQQDQSKFKDEILILQEFLVGHGAELRRSLNEKKYGTDFRDLVRRLRNEGSIDKLTRSRLWEVVENMGEEDLEAEVRKYDDRIRRISRWVLTLKEVENAEG